MPRTFLWEVWFVCSNFKWSWLAFKQLLAKQPDVIILQSFKGWGANRPEYINVCLLQKKTASAVKSLLFHENLEEPLPVRTGRLLPLLFWLGSQNFETNPYWFIQHFACLTLTLWFTLSSLNLFNAFQSDYEELLGIYETFLWVLWWLNDL